MGGGCYDYVYQKCLSDIAYDDDTDKLLGSMLGDKHENVQRAGRRLRYLIKMYKEYMHILCTELDQLNEVMYCVESCDSGDGSYESVLKAAADWVKQNDE